MTPVELTPPPGRTGAGTWHALGPFLRPQWPALAGAGGSTVVLALTELAKPWPLAIVIDHIVRGREGSFALHSQDLRLLALVVGLILAIALAEALAQYLADRWLLSAGERITHTLRVAVYTHLHRLSLGFHQRRQKGDLVARVTADVNAVGDLFAQSLGTIAQDILLLLGMAAVTVTIDPVLALVSFVAAPALGILSFSYRRRVRHQSRIQRAQEGEIASLANEALSAMAVVKAHGSEHFERERVHARSAERMRVGLSVSRLQARFDGIIGVVNAAAMALVIVVGVQRIAAGALSAGELIVFAQYVRRLNSPLREMAREGTKLARTMARADRVAEILSADELLDERPGAHHGPAATGDIELEHVTFGYDPKRPVLDDVSLRVPAGSCVAVVGESGAGKSTIGALVARFYDPIAGRLLIDGRDARDCSLAWLRAQVGMVLQDTVLFSGTVAENIAYGTGAGMTEIMAAARVAAADEFIRALPDGYDTELSPQGAGLSGGQRQRIGIARTLVRDPRILVLDEPTTGLDADSEAEVVAGLRALMRSRTTLLITHSMELARTADEVVVLEHGRIVAQGPPEVVLSRGGVLEEVVGSQRTDAALVAPEGEAAA
jgi:ATP-binding cassette subfamily B protein/subfamily B ATP-binding cassette protein MsbA